MSKEKIIKTRSGRISKPPKRFSDEKFLKGSGKGKNGVDFKQFNEAYKVF